MSGRVTRVRYGVVLTHSDLVDYCLSQQPFVRQQQHMPQLLASASHHNTGVGQRPVARGEGGRGEGERKGRKGGGGRGREREEGEEGK